MTVGHLERAEAYARLGNWLFVVDTRERIWSPQMFALFGLDPADGLPDWADVSGADRPRRPTATAGCEGVHGGR